MSAAPEPQPQDSTQEAPAAAEVGDVTCLACGCLCDDVSLVVQGGRVVEARRACELGKQWFLGDHAQEGVEPARVEGRTADPDEAVGRAAEILKRARAPVVLGLSRTSGEAVAEALAVADRIGGLIDPDLARAAGPRLRAVQRVGRVSATLGEVKNRADVVVFWGADPVVTHPRHWERYSVEPRGRFVPRGRDDRTVIVVDAERTATAERADVFVRVAPEAWFEALWVVRALLRGVGLDPSQVERATKVSLGELGELADWLRRASYGAWFHGPEFGRAPGGAALVEAALALVRELNAHTRFVLLSLGGPGNPAGAEAVVTWQTGYPGPVDFAGGFPRSGPDLSAITALERGTADAALVVADDVGPDLSATARDRLDRIPRIVIAPRATERPAAVALASATCGIDAGGTVMRTDGVTLPLRPALTPTLPTDVDWLRAIRGRLETADDSPQRAQRERRK